jgi:hypothetical protein
MILAMIIIGIGGVMAEEESDNDMPGESGACEIPVYEDGEPICEADCPAEPEVNAIDQPNDQLNDYKKTTVAPMDPESESQSDYYQNGFDGADMRDDAESLDTTDDIDMSGGEQDVTYKDLAGDEIKDLEETLPDLSVFITIEHIETCLPYSSEIILTGHLTGCEGLEYRLIWIKNEGERWEEIPGADEIEYRFKPDEQNISYTYRLLMLKKL